MQQQKISLQARGDDEGHKPRRKSYVMTLYKRGCITGEAAKAALELQANLRVIRGSASCSSALFTASGGTRAPISDGQGQQRRAIRQIEAASLVRRWVLALDKAAIPLSQVLDVVDAELSFVTVDRRYGVRNGTTKQLFVAALGLFRSLKSAPPQTP